jgi:hypothetical protein
MSWRLSRLCRHSCPPRIILSRFEVVRPSATLVKAVAGAATSTAEALMSLLAESPHAIGDAQDALRLAAATAYAWVTTDTDLEAVQWFEYAPHDGADRIGAYATSIQRQSSRPRSALRRSANSPGAGCTGTRAPRGLYNRPSGTPA